MFLTNFREFGEPDDSENDRPVDEMAALIDSLVQAEALRAEPVETVFELTRLLKERQTDRITKLVEECTKKPQAARALLDVLTAGPECAGELFGGISPLEAALLLREFDRHDPFASDTLLTMLRAIDPATAMCIGQAFGHGANGGYTAGFGHAQGYNSQDDISHPGTGYPKTYSFHS